MDAGTELRSARLAAGLSQRELAELAGTSQPAVALYESGEREPGFSTLARLLAATGSRLRVEGGHTQVKTPGRAELERVNSQLMDVLDLASKLPTKHSPTLDFPRLAK
jgi:transcriptional regulator with XRE-family HTH domain